MASNPMQRKSKNSFILGLVLGLFFVVLVAAVFIFQIKTLNNQITKLKGDRVSVYVLNEDIKSGEIVSDGMFSKIEVDINTVPRGATDDISTIQGYSLVDQDGNRIVTLVDKTTGQKNKYVIIDDEEYLLNEEGSKYYITVNNEQKEIEFENAALVAKINMNKNTVVTSSMFTTTDELTTNDLRKQEYNMIVLPSQLETNTYVDIRLRMPSGLDYIVLSKKKVKIPDVGGIPSENTIWLNMTEAETLIMSEAIVESYMIEGAMLYATEYVDPGFQDQSTPTFVANETTINLITQNPNVVQEAATEILNRYKGDNIQTRSKITAEINKNVDSAQSNAVSKTQTEITNRQTLRKNYLDALSGD